jgi:hypothetical protein
VCVNTNIYKGCVTETVQVGVSFQTRSTGSDSKSLLRFTGGNKPTSGGGDVGNSRRYTFLVEFSWTYNTENG